MMPKWIKVIHKIRKMVCEDCPVCYECTPLCTFTCGHSFCHTCTKEWYNKGQPTCPMCRASMCFRGILKKKHTWYLERREQVYTDLIAQVFDDLFDDYSDVIIDCMRVVQDRYEYTITKYPTISCDALDFVIRFSSIDVDYILNSCSEKIYEPATYKKYIMISNCTYGVINNKHPLHVYW